MFQICMGMGFFLFILLIWLFHFYGNMLYKGIHTPLLSPCGKFTRFLVTIFFFIYGSLRIRLSLSMLLHPWILTSLIKLSFTSQNFKPFYSIGEKLLVRLAGCYPTLLLRIIHISTHIDILYHVHSHNHQTIIGLSILRCQKYLLMWG